MLLVTPIFLALLLTTVAFQASAQERYTPSSDGDEINDTKTGLTWRRCAEGMTWKKSTCAGKATFANQAQAVALAKAQATKDEAWRLPTLKELNSILAVREIDVGKAAILAALQIADELFRARSDADQGTEKLEQTMEEIRRMLPPAKRAIGR